MREPVAFAKLTSLHTDGPVMVQPRFVVAVEGSTIHLFGHAITVRETHEEIKDRFVKALRWESGSADDGGADA